MLPAELYHFADAFRAPRGDCDLAPMMTSWSTRCIPCPSRGFTMRTTKNPPSNRYKPEHAGSFCIGGFFVLQVQLMHDIDDNDKN